MSLKSYLRFVIGKDGTADQLNTYLLSKAILDLKQEPIDDEEEQEEEPIDDEQDINFDIAAGGDEGEEEEPEIAAGGEEPEPEAEEEAEEEEEEDDEEEENPADEILDYFESKYDSLFIRNRLSVQKKVFLDERLKLDIDCEYSPPKNLNLRAHEDVEVIIFADPDFFERKNRRDPPKIKGYLSFEVDEEDDSVRLHYVCSGDVFPTPFEVFLDACKPYSRVRVKSSLSGLIFFGRYSFVNEDGANPVNLWRSFLKKNHRTLFNKDDLKNPQSATYKQFRKFVGSESVELVLNLKKRKVSARTVKTRRSSSTNKK